MHKSFNDIMEAARTSSRTTRIAVAGAEGKAVLGAMAHAADEGLVTPLLVGNREKCETIAAEAGFSLEGVEFYDVTGESNI